MQKLMNKKEMAEILGVTVKTVDKWVSKNLIPYIKISNKCVRFNSETMEKFFKSKLVPNKE